MEISSVRFLDRMEHGWCLPQSDLKVEQQLICNVLFYTCWVQKCDSFQSSKEMLTTCSAAGSSWLKEESDAMLSNTKKTDVKNRL